MSLAEQTGQRQAVHQSYHWELCRAMEWLGTNGKVVFLGQGVGCEGTAMSNTLTNVPAGKRLELPVAEEMQVGMCIGMSLKGLIPVCIIPRWNFALRAADQIINHLDRLPIYSAGGYRPKVLIRVAVPSTSPFNPQAQHDADFTMAFRSMLRTVTVRCLYDAAHIVEAYQHAMASEYSSILVEYTDEYRNARA